MVGELTEKIEAHPGWYHTIELPDGVETPGSCDLRPLAKDALPASLAGKRCLDVGTFDGFWAFEMEKRGGSVQALDLEDITQADLPPNTRPAILEGHDPSLPWGSGFRIAHEALGSSVQRVTGNVYDLHVGQLGEPVDFVLCGTILQHLRNPVGALERMREVLKPDGVVLMVETYSKPLTKKFSKRAVAEFRPADPRSIYTWWAPNLLALQEWARCAGLEPTKPPFADHKPLRGAGEEDRLVAIELRASR